MEEIATETDEECAAWLQEHYVYKVAVVVVIFVGIVVVFFIVAIVVVVVIFLVFSFF